MSIDSLSIKEKKEFVILTAEKTVALGQIKTPARPRFLIENGSAQGIIGRVVLYTGRFESRCKNK